MTKMGNYKNGIIFKFVGQSGRTSYSIRYFNNLSRKHYWEDISYDKFMSITRSK